MDEPEMTASVESCSEASASKLDDGSIVVTSESLEPAITTGITTDATITDTTSTATVTKTNTAITTTTTNATATNITTDTNITNGNTTTTTTTTASGQTKSQNVPPWRSYNGPKLYVKPVSRTSNQQIIHKAIAKALEGAANANTLKKIQETLQANIKTSNHFLILFRNHQFKGIYDYNEKLATITKLDGLGPKTISLENIVRFYKFDSTKRAFTEVETKQIGPTIIAISLSTYNPK